jgi:hypothetical protein
VADPDAGRDERGAHHERHYGDHGDGEGAEQLADATLSATATANTANTGSAVVVRYEVSAPAGTGGAARVAVTGTVAAVTDAVAVTGTVTVPVGVGVPVAGRATIPDQAGTAAAVITNTHVLAVAGKRGVVVRAFIRDFAFASPAACAASAAST